MPHVIGWILKFGKEIMCLLGFLTNAVNVARSAKKLKILNQQNHMQKPNVHSQTN